VIRIGVIVGVLAVFSGCKANEPAMAAPEVPVTSVAVAGDCQQPSWAEFWDQPSGTTKAFTVPGLVEFHYPSAGWIATADGRNERFVPRATAVLYSQTSKSVIRVTLWPKRFNGQAYDPKRLLRELVQHLPREQRRVITCTSGASNHCFPDKVTVCSTVFRAVNSQEVVFIEARPLSNDDPHLLLLITHMDLSNNDSQKQAFIASDRVYFSARPAK
jgi:hypothetical protein